jgi:hypothetical protein
MSNTTLTINIFNPWLYLSGILGSPNRPSPVCVIERMPFILTRAHMPASDDGAMGRQ